RIEIAQLAVVAVAGAPHGRVPGTRVAGAVEHRIGLGIVGADQPGHTAAVLPAVALPGVVAGLARTGHGPGPPHLLAGLDVVGLQAAARAVFAAAEAGDDLVLHDERRRGDHRALLVVDDLGDPQLLAGLGVERGK